MIKTPMDAPSGPGTTVGVNVALSGTLKDENDITIFGMVDGEVVSKQSVTVGETAQVKGPIHGHTVTIAGVARGSIDASEKLEILSTGKVFGSITTKNLVVNSGATLVGKEIIAGEEPMEEVAPAVTAPISEPKEEKTEVPAGVNEDIHQPDEE